MFPDIPKTKRELLNALTLNLRKYVESKVPVMNRIRSLAQHEGRTHSYERFDAPPVSEGYQEHAARLEVRMEEVPTLINERLVAKMIAVGDEMVVSLSKMFDDKLKEVTEEAGNVVDGKGQPFSQEMYFEMLEKILVDFDEQGRPTTSFHGPPGMAAALNAKIQEWMLDPAFRERWQTIWQRKRLEWRDRESNRKLVD